MATVFHQIQYWTWTLAPGQSLWLSYGPDDRYKNGTVQVMCSPATQVGDTTVQQTQTLSVPEVFNTQVPTVSGDLVFTSAYAGFNVTNRGNYTIKYFSVAITVIGP
jgi:hypothetical protein